MLIHGGAVLGRRIGIPELLTGLTIVAFGTSLPELIVNLFAASKGETELTLSNVVGSNIANILLILGVVAIIHPLSVHRTVVYREIIFNILASIMLAVLVADTFIDSSSGFAGIDTIDGIVLMSYFILFLYYAFGRSGFEARSSAHRKVTEIAIPATF